jgi:hypothetical protein
MQYTSCISIIATDAKYNVTYALDTERFHPLARTSSRVLLTGQNICYATHRRDVCESRGTKATVFLAFVPFVIFFVYLAAKALYHKRHKDLHKEHYVKSNKGNTESNEE